MGKFDDLYKEDLYNKLDQIFGVNSANKISNKVSNGIQTDLIERMKEAFDSIQNLKEGYAVVEINGKVNLATQYMDVISKTWFDDITYFKNNRAVVKKGNQFNIIDMNGKLLFKEWISNIKPLEDGNFIGLYKNKEFLINSSGKIISEAYDKIKNFENGYAQVIKNDKINYIGSNGKLVSNKWFSKVDYRKVKGNNGKYTFADSKNEAVVKAWFDKVDDYIDGYARILLDGKYNFLDEKGKLLSTVWYDGASNFEKGYARVKKDNKVNVIDGTGKFISIEWYDAIDVPINGYMRVRQGEKFNLISTFTGELASLEWYDNIYSYENGFAIVKKFDRYGVINEEGKLVTSNWYDAVSPFIDGFAKVRLNGKYNYIDEMGEPLNKNWYDKISDYNDFFLVTANNQKNILDGNGRVLCKEWFDDIGEYENGYLPVKKGEKWNLLNKNGILISNQWFDEVEKFEKGYAKVKIGDYKYRIDSHGTMLLVVEQDNQYNYLGPDDGVLWNWTDSKEKLLSINKKILFNRIDLDGYSTTKSLFGYKCTKKDKNNKEDSFHIKYKPIKTYGTKYVLCVNKENVYLYNKDSNSYEKISNVYDIIYDNNFIFDGKNVFLMYENKKINITDYYMKNLKSNKRINLTPGVKDLFTKEEFEYENSDLRKKIAEEEKEQEAKNKEKAEREAELMKLQKAKEEALAKEEERKIRRIKNIENVRKVVEEANKLRKPDEPIIRAKVENIFEDVDDHKEIMEELKDLLPFIDLSTFSFKNVDVEGVSFKDCNPHITPQEVYKKSLNGCDFTGVHFEPIANFKDIDIRGTKFSADSDPMTLDMLPLTFKDAMYDENTTYNNKSLIELLDEAKKVNNQK